MHYLLALSPPAGCGQGLDPVPERNDWEREEWGVRRANQTSKCPIKYCSLPRIWKSSGAKGRDGERKKKILEESKAERFWEGYDLAAWYNKLFIKRQFAMVAEWFRCQCRHPPHPHPRHMHHPQGSRNLQYTLAMVQLPKQYEAVREGGKKPHSLTTLLLWISCSAFIITCVCGRESNRTEPVDWDKQPFYNEGWSRSAIQRRSSC